tara:strand:+ start:57 stop:194 length:138 start_codon:yes stop_codon:yes gene_type:complete
MMITMFGFLEPKLLDSEQRSRSRKKRKPDERTVRKQSRTTEEGFM